MLTTIILLLASLPTGYYWETEEREREDPAKDAIQRILERKEDAVEIIAVPTAAGGKASVTVPPTKLRNGLIITKDEDGALKLEKRVGVVAEEDAGPVQEYNVVTPSVLNQNVEEWKARVRELYGKVKNRALEAPLETTLGAAVGLLLVVVYVQRRNGRAARMRALVREGELNAFINGVTRDREVACMQDKPDPIGQPLSFPLHHAFDNQSTTVHDVLAEVRKTTEVITASLKIAYADATEKVSEAHTAANEHMLSMVSEVLTRANSANALHLEAMQDARQLYKEMNDETVEKMSDMGQKGFDTLREVAAEYSSAVIAAIRSQDCDCDDDNEPEGLNQ